MPAVLEILDGASTWLGGKATDQWQTGRWRAEELRPDLAPGGLRVAETWPGPVAVGTVTLRDTHAAELWRPADEPGSALYLHRLAVDRAFAGRGVGAWLLDLAVEEARRAGKRRLRLDAWSTNARLHDYYRGQGFRLVRIVGSSPSGALFERTVSPP
ncbi:GNAT family N-acetyltransferase [Amycolatopsis sp. OK19-0408]|uniref:GNAT family N-acetyltransferase n=1 Tax=Amycolatopsis iheyensis TaxID=2945988 RepID=A0A9X2ND64_9PSEU|nr:GNAT family N-acetyltransferase [Amycolatopsis iheyensis]MCR6484519.1 GNAT family N-acetyltransferase [Amycolatopsis iheyensis]